MIQKTAKANQSVEKTFHIIETMAACRYPMRLQDIAEKTNLPPSTALRMLNTLLIYGYVNQDSETLKYSLSMKFAHIGSIVSSQISIRDIIHPYLIELTQKCHEASCAAIVDDDEMEIVYIDVIDGPGTMLKTMQYIGKRAPMHCTGVGKNLLLNYDENKIDQMIGKHGMKALTPYTITSKEELLKELKKVSEQGYAYDNEECELGARCVAAPIRDYTGKVVASISVSGPTSRFNKERAESCKDIVIQFANKISSKLSYNGDKNGI